MTTLKETGAVSLNGDGLGHYSCVHGPLAFSRLWLLFISGSDGASIQVDSDFSPFARREMLSRTLPSMNTNPLFPNYDAFGSSGSHARLCTITPFRCPQWRCWGSGNKAKCCVKNLVCRLILKVCPQQ